jgi:adenylate cyclase
MARLVVEKGYDKGTIFEITKPVTTIGRIAPNEIILSDMSISRSHAEIIKEKDAYFIRDKKSKNGTYVNGTLITKARIKNGDRIKIGRVEFSFLEKPVGEIIFKQDASREILDQSNTIIKSLDRTEHDLVDLRKRGKSLTYEKKLAILYQIGRDINSILNLEKLLDKIIDSIFSVIEADRVFLMLRDEKSGQLIPKIARDRKARVPSQIAVSRTIIDTCLKNKQAILTADAFQDPRFQKGESIATFKIKSAMCVPLWIKDKIIGIIHVDNNLTAGVFKEDDLDLLSALANQSAIAIENARLYENVRSEVRLRSNLQRYLSPGVVDKIMEESGEISLGGEKKEVTILFADIRDFTGRAEKMDPAAIVEMLNEYFLQMTDLVFKYEGTVDKYIGDCLMAIFGAPFSHSDDPLRAVYCALEMQKQLKSLQEEWRREGREIFEVGIGINTGEVVAGNIGSTQRMEYTVIGDNVNIAERIEEVARGKQILISESTYQKVKGKIKVNKLAPLVLKGKTHPVSVFEVKGSIR